RGIDGRPDSPFSLDGYTRHPPDGEPFTTLRRLSASSAADFEAHAGVLRHERDAAVADGRIFDAMLANFAAGLSTGDQSEATAWVAAHRDQINANADAQSLVRNLNPKDANTAKVAADTLEKMKRSAGPHSYVLNIFEGNIRFGLHQGAGLHSSVLNFFKAIIRFALPRGPGLSTYSSPPWPPNRPSRALGLTSETCTTAPSGPTPPGPVGMLLDLSAPRTTCSNKSMIWNASCAPTIRSSSSRPNISGLARVRLT